MYFRLSWALKKLLILRFDNEEAEKIVTVGDAVEQIKNANKFRESRKKPICGLFLFEE